MLRIQDKVEWILAESIEARNSDIELYIQYFQKYICEYPEEKDFIRRIFERAGTNIAGLTRIRAKIQNTEWLYLSDKQVQKLRDKKEQEIRTELSPINNWTRY